MADYKKPLPVSTIEQKPFWEHCRKHELRMQRCPECGHIRNPASIVCPKCHSLAEAEWVKLSGKGKVYTFDIPRRLCDKSFAADVPYVVISVALEEGPRMVSNLTGCKVEDVKVDLPVEVYFDDVTPEVTLPKFKPAK